jgi:hypothetical protein
MNILLVVWAIIAVALWGHYKFKRSAKPEQHGDAPTQSTFLGALMWPFYLVAYLYEQTKKWLVERTKTDE